MQDGEKRDLEETLRLIPGYDPFATKANCWLDHDAAQLAIDFFGHPEDGCLRHIEGQLAGERFVLEPWQKAIVGNLFGWKYIDSAGREVRRYREAFIYVPRKNGKSPMGAGIALFVLFCDPEIGQQDYVAAADREQAGMLFRHAKEMVEREPSLKMRCRIFGGHAEAGQSRSIMLHKGHSYLRVVSADAETKHGGNSHLVIVDELHTQPSPELFNVLTTSTASKNRKQTLIISISTADYDRPSLCNDKYQEACEVRDNGGDPEKPGYDPHFLPVIYELSRDDDWTDEANWKKANPNLDVSVSLDYLRRECEKAKHNAAYANTFKRLHLNVITQQSVLWLPLETWDLGAKPFDPAILEGQRCWGGFDMSSTQDTTAYVLVFPDIEGETYVKAWFWVPNDTANQREREKKDRVSYLTWEKAGYLKLTQDNAIDEDEIEADMAKTFELYDVQQIAFDRHLARKFAMRVMRHGPEMVEFGQGFISMTPATQKVEKLALNGRLRHGGNPVLRWMIGNCQVVIDTAGNQKLSKKHSRGRIDGAVSLAMALQIAPEIDDSDDGLPHIGFVELPSWR